MIPWRKRETHPELFEDGETLLVAVRACSPDKSREWWDLSVITIRCDEDYFECEMVDGFWGWDWDDVEYWCPVSEIEPKDEEKKP